MKGRPLKVRDKRGHDQADGGRGGEGGGDREGDGVDAADGVLVLACVNFSPVQEIEVLHDLDGCFQLRI